MIKKRLLLLLLLTTLTGKLFSQTTLTIIGTTHQKTSHINADTLFNLLQKIKPDVILLELDTALMDANGNAKGRAKTDNGNERLVSERYRAVDNKVIFRRFDIEDRSFYYNTHKTFAIENELGRIMDSLWKKNLLQPQYMQIITALNRADQALNVMTDMSIQTLNSKAFLNFAAYRQDWMYNKQIEVIANTPELKKYYAFYKDDGDFWIRRNQAMIKNIAGYIKFFKGKRIVVLTGAMHKYFLTDGLLPMQKELSFVLNDLPQ